MSNARLLSLTLERFKSYEKATEIPFSPLTVVLGRNNSGKSSIIQALLLLKQTLAEPRPEVPLNLQGALFDALYLREITSGWPGAGAEVPGPRTDRSRPTRRRILLTSWMMSSGSAVITRGLFRRSRGTGMSSSETWYGRFVDG